MVSRTGWVDITAGRVIGLSELIAMIAMGVRGKVTNAMLALNFPIGHVEWRSRLKAEMKQPVLIVTVITVGQKPGTRTCIGNRVPGP